MSGGEWRCPACGLTTDMEPHPSNTRAACAATAEQYAAYVERTGIAGYRATPGNRGAWLLRRVEGESAEFLTLSLWESLDAVRAFAGPDHV